MRYDWVWDGGLLCLDLINTLRDRHATPHEMLSAPEDLAIWLREAGIAAGPAAPHHLQDARRLREQLDRVLAATASRHSPDAGDIDQINAWACQAPIPQLRLRNGQITPTATAPSHDAVEAALGMVAADAVALLSGEARPAVRVCAADTCGLRFLDRSPTLNRQWCSMSRCGNRAKARSHYARHRRASSCATEQGGRDRQTRSWKGGARTGGA